MKTELTVQTSPEGTTESPSGRRTLNPNSKAETQPTCRRARAGVDGTQATNAENLKRQNTNLGHGSMGGAGGAWGGGP